MLVHFAALFVHNPLVDNPLIISRLRKILGVKRAEDYKQLIDNQAFGGQAIYRFSAASTALK